MSLGAKFRNSFNAWTDTGNAGTVKIIARSLQFILAWLALVILAAWSISPLRAFLEREALFDRDTIVGIFGVMVALILSSLDDLFKRTKKLDESIESLRPTQSTFIKRGITDVYGPLLEEMKTVSPKERSLDVLGLTLFTAWPQLRGWLDASDTIGWTIQLLCLSPVLEEKKIPGVPSRWMDAAKNMMGQIKDYQRNSATNLKSRRITIDLKEYQAFPGLHGFLLGNGTLFISCTHWDEEQDQLADPYHFYEKFDRSDHSERADAYRSLFRNWLSHARRTIFSSVVNEDKLT